MNPYTAAGWDNFFVAEAGASAALAGLLFVALSINLQRIMSLPTLPGRAAEGLVSLIAGISLLLGAGGGLHWIVVAFLGAFVQATLNAWVLMVEILR
jgi:hypothetical protein